MSDAYDRDKLVELFGDDPATLAEVERAAKAEDLPTVRRLREMFSHEVRRVAEQAGLAVD